MKVNSLLLSFALTGAAVGMLTACSDEFGYGDADGQLKMKLVVNSELTRAEVDDAELSEKCMIYISSSKGLIHKFEGLSSVPEELWLKSGNYVAEAWTGDSVSASFDKKFYRAYEPFEIKPGVNNLMINCKIANVVASVDRSRVSDELLPSFSVTVANSRGELVFNADNFEEAKGYFMMPNADTDLTYSISGTNMIGTEFTKTGKIPNVKRAHEYVLHLSYNAAEDPTDVGGAFINISIDDREVIINGEIVIEALPQLIGLGREISKPIVGEKGSFSDLILAGACAGEFHKVGMIFSDDKAFGLDYDRYDLTGITDLVRLDLEGKGFTWTIGQNADTGDGELYLKVPAAILNNLDNGSYTLVVRLGDSRDREKDYTIKIEVSDAKVIVSPVNKEEVTSYTAVVHASVVKADATNPGIRYREAGTSQWTSVRADATRAQNITVTLKGLKAGTTYQVQPIADGFEGNATEEFTTEPAYSIPNASFEDWSTYSFSGVNNPVPFPGIGSAPSFWSSGNAGSMKMNVAVTQSSTDMKHSGSYSIRLGTDYPSMLGIGKMAAGNVFSGDYVKTDGTDGELLWGREMPTCHPVMLSGWANYRPASVEWNGNGGPLSVGDTDKGTVYIAITTKKVDVKTKSKVFFDKDADYVLAYGEVIWDSNFGPDGQLQSFQIPVTWKKRNYDGQMYLIIVASSSKYGDYFNGGRSVMYLDDLVLTYE